MYVVHSYMLNRDMSRVIEELTAVAPTFSLSSSVVQAPTFNIHIIS